MDKRIPLCPWCDGPFAEKRDGLGWCMECGIWSFLAAQRPT